MDKKPPVVINIESDHLINVLGIVQSVANGESSPLFLEGKVNELKEYVPSLPNAISLMATAMDLVSEAKRKDVGNDISALRDFLINLDMLSRTQGVLAALLCVGESLQSDAKREVETNKFTPKKPRKGNRNVKKS